jgi:S-layer protein Slr4
MSTQKNLVALTVGAIVAASAGVALAGGVSATGGRVSTQYAAAVGAATTTAARQVALSDLGSTAVTARLNAEYALNDTITFTFACACLVDTSLPSTLTSTTAGGQTLTFALLNSSADAATYRVTNRANSASTKNLEVTLPNTVKVDMSKAASGVSVAFSAATSSGAAFDTSLTFDPTTTDFAASKTLVTVSNQFAGSVVTSLDGIIDVNPAAGTTPLTTFTTGTSDVFTVKTHQATVTTTFAKTADVSAVTYTLSGDFSWATEARKASVFTPSCPSGSTASAVTLVASATGSVSWNCVGRDAVGESSSSGGSSSLTINAAGQTGLTALPTATFTVASSTSYFSPSGQSGATGTTTSSSTIAANTAAGSWTINGAQIFVPYMPYGSTIDQVIYVANKSSVTGDISVQYIGTDTTSVVNLGKVGSVSGRSTLNISPLIKAALPAAAQASGRLAFIITINAPANDVDILASYRIGDDRAFVQTRKLN